MYILPYHVPLVIKQFSTMKQFTSQCVETNNDDAKWIFFQKSNKWDAARDVLLLELRQLALQSHGREKWKDTKKDDYWDGIVETRKKRQRSQAIVTEAPDQEPGPSTAANSGYEDDLNRLSVKELGEDQIKDNLNKGTSEVKEMWANRSLKKCLLTVQSHNYLETWMWVFKQCLVAVVRLYQKQNII